VSPLNDKLLSRSVYLSYKGDIQKDVSRGLSLSIKDKYEKTICYAKSGVQCL